MQRTHKLDTLISLTTAISLALVAGCDATLSDDSPEGLNDDLIGESQLALTAPNLLANAGFDHIGPNGSPVTVITSVPGGAGNSAAARWTMFTNSAGYISSELRPSTRPGGSGRMIRVLTRGERNGLVQVFDSYGRGPAASIAYAWVYVVSGQVGIGTGNGGNTAVNAKSTVVGQWQRLEAPNGMSPANEFIIYSTVPGTEFYVDDAGVYSKNLVANPSFETVGPNNSPTTVTTSVPGGAGNSAADKWTLFTNTPGSIFTEQVGYLSSPGGSATTLHVITDGDRNGLVQVFAPYNSGPTHSISAVWVYVRQGTVGLGTGNGGNTGLDALSTTTNQWELLQAPNGVSPANELIVYSVGGGADFYVDDAEVYATP